MLEWSQWKLWGEKNGVEVFLHISNWEADQSLDKAAWVAFKQYPLKQKGYESPMQDKPSKRDIINLSEALKF